MNPAELALELYRLLSPYDADMRQKAIHAALVSLGDTLTKPRAIDAPGGSVLDPGEFRDLALGPKALKWAQRHGVTPAMLEEVFHITEHGVDITASSIPGASKREMTVNCYLLSGLRGLLKSDVAQLDDSEAIAVCKRLTAYDKNNHPANRSSVGNKMTGTKPTFTLTGPGEAAAAELVKQMAAGRA